MTGIVLLLYALGILFTGSLASIALSNFERVARLVGCVLGAAGCALALVAGALAILGTPMSTSAGTAAGTPLTPVTLSLGSIFGFADFTVRLSALEGFFVCVVALLAFACMIYSIGYFDGYGPRSGLLCMLMNLFIACILLTIVCDNAFWFLTFFEFTSMTSYFLVVIGRSPGSVRAGFIYVVMTHVGFVLVTIAFLILAVDAGTLEFSGFRSLALTPARASLCFMLAFLGFATKSGAVPVHSWLALAHPAAPSNVSALLSGGMLKLGIFGIIKVGVDLLGASQIQQWWGIVVIVVGAVSALIGVLFALMEHDLKRLLAYHSVENIGIILLGIGVALVGCANGNVALAIIGLVAALCHTASHAMFKGNLFLGTGAIKRAAGTSDLDLLGGLIRTMPWTAGCFLVGVLALCAVPPLNGFTSELLTFQALFEAALAQDKVALVTCTLAATAFALSSVLAIMCLAKAFGMAFLTAPRTSQARNAHEVGASMIAGQLILALTCVVMGIAAPVFVSMVSRVSAATLAPLFAGTSVVGASIDAIEASAALDGNLAILGVDSAPLIALLVVIVSALIVVAVRGLGSRLAPKTVQSWASGYNPDLASMMPFSGSFASIIKDFFAPVYLLRDRCIAGCGRIVALFSKLPALSLHIEDFERDKVESGVAKSIGWLSMRVRSLARGSLNAYLGYIVAALVVALVLAMAL